MVNIISNSSDILLFKSGINNPAIVPVSVTNETSKGMFSGVGNFFSKIGPMIPFILGIAFLIVLIILAWGYFSKRGKQFQKDYSNESYKEKLRFYSRNPTRISSSKWGWSLSLEILVIGVSVIVGLLLFGMNWIPKFPTFWVILIPVIFGVVLILINLANPLLWSSFPKAVNSRGEIIGFMLSIPVESPDGFLECLIFKKTKWIILKQIDILSIPIKDKFSFPQKTGKILTFEIDIKREDRYKILGNGDLLVNTPDFFATKYHIYPNLSSKTKTFDLRDIVFLKEKKDGDLLNLSDMANEFRENSVILAGGNPHNRISGEGTNTRKDNFEGE